MDLQNDVIYADGQENMGGLKKSAFIGLVSEFLSIATPIAVPAAYGDLVTIPGSHVLMTGKQTIELYVMYDKSGVDSPSAGQRKGKSSKPKATLMYPGNDAQILGLLSLIKNSDCLLFLEPLDNSAGYIQIGTQDLPATLTSYDIKTGNSPEAEKGVTLVFEAPSRVPYYLYTGILPRLGA